MTQLNAEKNHTLQTQLLDLVTRLRAEIAVALHSAGPAETLGLANHLQDVDDDAVASLETSLDVAAIERDMRELRDAELALERLSKSEYGVCVRCGEEIPFKRLQASPTASQCIACLTRDERLHGKAGGRSI